MKRLFGTFILAMLITTPAWAGDHHRATTLRQCYDAALAQSEVVARSTEEIEFARARFGTVLSGALPRLEATGSELLQDPAAATGNAFSDSFTRLSRPEVAITFSQPLFHGLKELYGLRAARAYREQTQAMFDEARRLLFGDVSTVYYTMARFDRAIRTTTHIIAVLQQQLSELYRQVALGKTRAAEVAAAEAELARHRAQLETVKGQRAVAGEAMAFLTGHAVPSVPALTAPPKSTYTLEQYVALVQRRPDVRAASLARAVQTQQMKAVRADLWPHADVDANYYPYRTEFQSDMKWDVQFKLTVPLTPLKEYNALREAKVRARQESLRATETARRAEADLRKAHASYLAARREYHSYTTAATRAEQSYHLQTNDYEKGLINLLQLLDTQRRWVESLTARDNAQASAALLYTQLELAAGVLP